MQFRIERPDQGDVVALIALLDDYQTRLYPPECHYGVDISTLCQPNVLFAVARTNNGRAVGCAAIMLKPTYGEIKRMFVLPELRGQRVAVQLLAMLEHLAIGQGCTLFRLETGIFQPEAIRTYASAGYTKRGPFDRYSDDPYSVFMEKMAQA